MHALRFAPSSRVLRFGPRGPRSGACREGAQRRRRDRALGHAVGDRESRPGKTSFSFATDLFATPAGTVFVSRNVSGVAGEGGIVSSPTPGTPTYSWGEQGEAGGFVVDEQGRLVVAVFDQIAADLFRITRVRNLDGTEPFELAEVFFGGLTLVPVPEPASLLLVGTGLALPGAAARGAPRRSADAPAARAGALYPRAMTAPSLPHRMRLWRACRPDFGPDGSAQRIYVLEIGEAEWDALLRAVPRGPWPYRFSLDDLTAPLPKYGIEAFAAWRQAAPLLELAVGPAVVRCRFGSVQQLELELDPAEVGDPDALEALVRLMAWLGRLLRRSVVLAPDDAPERPILEYDDASRRVRFHAAATP